MKNGATTLALMAAMLCGLGVFGASVSAPEIAQPPPLEASQTRGVLRWTLHSPYFTDPSIATAALGLGPGDLMNDLKTFGLFFETLVARDLRTYAAANDGKISHYRDKSGLECDAVMHLRNGRYGLIEVKLGGSALIAEGRRKLQDLADEIDTKRMPAPSFMMIVVAEGDYAYKETDGTLICPIGCLRP